MKTKIGRYALGHEFVELFLDSDLNGGNFDFPDHAANSPMGVITVGSDQTWAGVHEVLLHEVVEYALARHRVRFKMCHKYNGDCAAFLFSFDHPIFASVIADASWFVTGCYSNLKKAHASQRRPKPKKAPKKKPKRA